MNERIGVFFGNGRLCESRFYIAHPSVIFMYFVGVFTFLFIYSNPIFIATIALVSVAMGVIYSNKGELASSLKIMLFVGLFVLIINPITNRRGTTTLFYLFDIKISLESLIYGGISMVSIVCLFLLFVPFNALVDSERFLYLFSKFTPKIAFITNMALRYIPTFNKRARDIIDVQKTRGVSLSNGSVTAKVKTASVLLESLFNMSLEEGMSVSMVLKSKEYGQKKRTSYTHYRFCLCDGVAMILMLVLLFVAVFFALFGGGYYSVFPTVYFPVFDAKTWVCYAVMVVYLAIPFMFELVTLIKRRSVR